MNIPWFIIGKHDFHGLNQGFGAGAGAGNFGIFAQSRCFYSPEAVAGAGASTFVQAPNRWFKFSKFFLEYFKLAVVAKKCSNKIKYLEPNNLGFGISRPAMYKQNDNLQAATFNLIRFQNSSFLFSL